MQSRSRRLLARGLVLALPLAFLPVAMLFNPDGGVRKPGLAAVPAKLASEGTGLALAEPVPELSFDPVPPPRRPLPAAPPAEDEDWGTGTTKNITLRVTFAGELLDLEAPRALLDIRPIWHGQSAFGSGSLQATEGLSIKLKPELVAGYESGGAVFDFSVGSLFRFSKPDSLLLRASRLDLTGQTVLSIGELGEVGELLTATVYMDSGTLVRGRVVPHQPGQVAAYMMLGNQPINPAVTQGVVLADGSFGLRLPGGSDYALCVLGAGDRPATARVSVGFGGVQQVPTILMPPGETIHGGLALMKTCDRATVTATLVGGAGHFSLGTHDFVWFQDAFEWRSRSTKPFDEHCEGEFLLTGLASGAYELGVSGVVHTDRVAVGRVPTVRAWAPAAGVDLAPYLARVRLRLEHEGEPIPDGSIPLVQDFGAGGTSYLQARTAKDGTAEFWLDPRAPAWLSGRESTRFLPADLDGAAPKAIQANLAATESARATANGQ